jgi:hypothetical protein
MYLNAEESEMDCGMSNRLDCRYEQFSVFRRSIGSPRRALIEAWTRKPQSGELRRPEEIEDISKERGVLI